MGNLSLILGMVLFVIYFTFILIPMIILLVTVVVGYFKIEDYKRIYLYREQNDKILWWIQT